MEKSREKERGKGVMGLPKGVDVGGGSVGGSRSDGAQRANDEPGRLGRLLLPGRLRGCSGDGVLSSREMHVGLSWT